MSDDQDLRVTLSEAAEGVEPGDRLVAIRQRTRRTARRRRSWWVGGGAALVAASVVTVAVVNGPSSPQRATDPAAPPPAPSTAYPVHYVGPGPSGPDAPEAVLYREQVEAASPLDALMTAPSDPDYRTLWPAGSLVSYVVGDEAIRVTVAPEAPLEDDLALQQLVHTLHAVEDSRSTVLIADIPGTRFPGFEVRRSDDLDVLSHMSIDEPAEGSTYASGESFVVTGRGNSFEASGQCALETGDGTVVDAYLAQMDGWIEPRLYPWELEVDLSDVPPGTYTLRCITDDPTGGTEGRGTDSDTRTVIVE
jgi:hypothetical protein